MFPYAVVGRNLRRIDANDKVTGQALFGADVRPAGILQAKLLHSPHAHARVLHIDYSRALRLPGVKAVITAADFPPVRYGFSIKDQTAMAGGKVRYGDEPVAAVAATSLDLAEEAVSLIRVEYEPLPGLFDPVAAMAPDAPLIHEEWQQYEANFAAKRWGNVCCQVKIQRGDVEEGFAQADEIFEDTFFTQMIHPAYIEPHAAIAQVGSGGKVTVWTPTQLPFYVRAILAQLLRMEQSQIRVIGTQVGGGFGGKAGVLLEPICVRLAQKAGRPVKLVLTRGEEFTVAYPRHPSTIRLKTGIRRDGTLTARHAAEVFDTGAYADFGPLTAGNSTTLVAGPYKIPHVAVEAVSVYTNRPICGATRAPGGPQASFAFESQMDIMAEALGWDPVELRLKNAVEEGYVWYTGQRLERVGFVSTLHRARDYVKAWRSQSAGDRRRRGVGIGCGQWRSSSYGSSACIRVNEDGTVTLMTGAVDIGTGSNTVLAQIAAEELGIPFDRIAVISADTEATPYDFGAVGSRTTYNAGRAVKIAAGQVREKLLALAADRLEVASDDLELREGRIVVKGSPQRGVTVAELSMVSHYAANGSGPIMGMGACLIPLPPVDHHLLHGHPKASMLVPTFVTQVAEVEVDEETGEISLLRLVSIDDVGFAINPQAVEGQIQGGATQGIGFALTEKVYFDQGRPLNPQLADYKLPTALDVPPIQTDLVEDTPSDGTFGEKGVAEPPAIPTAAAIANAIAAAVGVRFRELPMRPEGVVQALKTLNGS